jgi:chemotaxis protein histidine kinase CheA
MSDQKEVQDLDNQILKQMLQDFLEEALDLLDQLNLNLIQLEGDPGNEDYVNQIFRLVHTIKGSAGFAGLEEMSLLGRKMEEIFGKIRREAGTVSLPVIDAMFDGMEVLSNLREKAAAGDRSPVDIAETLERLDQACGRPAEAPPSEAQQPPAEEESGPLPPQELLDIYTSGYDQLSALKHLVYSSTQLKDEESLAVLFSKQINKKMSPEKNGIWLLNDQGKVAETARNGELVPADARTFFDVESSEVLKRVLNDQLVVWSSSLPDVKKLLPEFESPMIIPLKAQPRAYGFLVLDPEESAEVEVYQFVGQFAAMMLNISKLHHKVEQQRQELDEMTAMLFRQNAILSSLYHIELALMNIKNPVDLCRIVSEAFVHDLETRSAAIFLRENDNALKGLWGSGGLQSIEEIHLDIDSVEPVKQCIESGRIISHKDDADFLQLGTNRLDNWIIMGLKGRDKTHGVIISELDIDDVTDSMSILANYSGILLDNLILQDKTEE